MSVIINRSRWTRQPSYPVKPRARWRQRGLVFLFQGSTFADLCGSPVVPTNSGGIARRDNADAKYSWQGPYISGTQYLDFASRDDLNITGTLSIIWRGVFDATTGAYRCPVSKAYSDGGATNTPFEVYLDTTSGDITLYRSGSSGGRAMTLSTTAPTAGQTVTFGILCGSLMEIIPTAYINRIAQSVTDGGGGFTGGPLGNTFGLRIGRRQDGATQLTGSVDLAALFNQTLTAQEYLAIESAPWGELVEPINRRLYFDAAVSGGGVSPSAFPFIGAWPAQAAANAGTKAATFAE